MLCDPPPTDEEILPQAKQGSYFFNKIGRSLPVVTKACADQVECKRLVRTVAIDRSVAMQSGGQLHAITLQLSYWIFPPKSGHQPPVKLTLPLSTETPSVSRISTPSLDATHCSGRRRWPGL